MTGTKILKLKRGTEGRDATRAGFSHGRTKQVHVPISWRRGRDNSSVLYAEHDSAGLYRMLRRGNA